MGSAASSFSGPIAGALDDSRPRLTADRLARCMPRVMSQTTLRTDVAFSILARQGRMDEAFALPAVPLPAGELPIPLGYKKPDAAPGTPGVGAKDEGQGSTGSTNTGGAGSGPPK